MTIAPSPTSWSAGDTLTEAGLDTTETAINFLRSPPMAKLNRSSDQSVPNTTETAVQWNAETYDTHNGHDNTTDNTRYTAPYDGRYRLSASVPWAANANTTAVAMWFRRSDGVTYEGDERVKGTSNVVQCTSSSVVMEMLTGQYVEVYVWQNRGLASTIDASHRGGPQFDIEWVSAL